MSVAKTKARWFHIYSADRHIRKVIEGKTLDALIGEVRKKFGIHVTVAVNIVLEEDGTMVDDADYFEYGLKSDNVLMLLKSDEAWTERDTVVSEVYDDDNHHAEQTPNHRENIQLKKSLFTPASRS